VDDAGCVVDVEDDAAVAVVAFAVVAFASYY
jgi:hypothetical protein